MILASLTVLVGLATLVLIGDVSSNESIISLVVAIAGALFGAGSAVALSKEEEERQRRETLQLGAQRAQMAAQGLTLRAAERSMQVSAQLSSLDDQPQRHLAAAEIAHAHEALDTAAAMEREAQRANEEKGVVGFLKRATAIIGVATLLVTGVATFGDELRHLGETVTGKPAPPIVCIDEADKLVSSYKKSPEMAVAYIGMGRRAPDLTSDKFDKACPGQDLVIDGAIEEIAQEYREDDAAEDAKRPTPGLSDAAAVDRGES